MARPRIEIDKKMFENFCKYQCTEVEIAGFLDIDVDTLNAWCKRTYKKCFSDVFKKKSAGGKMSLRRLQYKSAEAGNVTMQIWLGKQWLGQTDKTAITAVSEDEKNKPLSVVEQVAVELMGKGSARE